jgi:hypothetical protein
MVEYNTYLRMFFVLLNLKDLTMQELARPVARIRLVPVHAISDGINTWMTENADIIRRIDEQEVRSPVLYISFVEDPDFGLEFRFFTGRIFLTGPDPVLLL